MRAIPLVLVSVLSLAACQGSPKAKPERTGGPLVLVAEPAAPQGKDADKEARDKAEKRAEELADKQKQLQQKQREIEYAKVERETAAIDRQTRTMTTAASLDKAKAELDKAKTALELFRSIDKPKEIEQRMIAHQYSVNSADHAKDELAELEAMYQAEEFAKATKELVIKRGRQRLELSERSLAVSKTEVDLLKEHTLPDKEKELVRKVADTELDLEKAKLEAEKARIELELSARKAKDRMQDLERDVGELQGKIEKLGKPEGGS